MKRPGSPASLLFRLVVPCCAVFIFIVLAMIASTFGDPRAPVAQWFNRHAGTLLKVTAAATIVLALLAMTVDRIRTLRSQSKERPADTKQSSTESSEKPQSDTLP